MCEVSLSENSSTTLRVQLAPDLRRQILGLRGPNRLPKILKTRRDFRRYFIEQQVDIHGARILEIGALDSPTYQKSEARISYLDWFTTEECCESIKDLQNRNVDKVVNVDYVIKTKHFAEYIDFSFDLIIANHVIEHIPDIVTWFSELQKILGPHGAIFLAIPDRRYTFDYLRPETDAVEILRCFQEDLQSASYYQILRSIFYFRPITTEDVWAGNIDKKKDARRYTFKQAIDLTRNLLDTGESVHCSVFSSSKFENLWNELIESGLVNLEIAHIQDVQPNTNEFFVLLRELRGNFY